MMASSNFSIATTTAVAPGSVSNYLAEHIWVSNNDLTAIFENNL